MQGTVGFVDFRGFMTAVRDYGRPQPQALQGRAGFSVRVWGLGFRA